MNELAVTNTSIVRTMGDAERAAQAMAASGYFQDSRQAAQALVKILAGLELGFGPFASMTGVSIIQGKPAIGANLIASAIKKTSKYNYRIMELTDQACEVAFYENGTEVGRSRFTLEDAQRAGLDTKDNWKKYPRNMLFSRAISNGQKWYAPDATNGLVYTPDELGATTDADGNVIDAEVTEPATQSPTSPEPASLPKLPTMDRATMDRATAEAVTNSQGLRYGDLGTEKLSYMRISLRKSLKENHLTPENREVQEYKLSAIEVILAARERDDDAAREAMNE